jgi:hypothetical protein
VQTILLSSKSRNHFGRNLTNRLGPQLRREHKLQLYFKHTYYAGRIESLGLLEYGGAQLTNSALMIRGNRFLTTE